MKRVKFIPVLIIALIMLLSVFMSACVPNFDLSFWENLQSGNNSSDNNDNQNEDNDDGNNNEDSTPDYSQYSPILQAVLTDPIYDKDGTDAPYPFHTLEQMGYPRNRINEKKDICRFIYIKGGDKNTLYYSMQLYFEDETYACLLSYNLNDGEYDELMMLIRGKYVQAGFWIQELDKQRTPTVLSAMKYTPGTVESFEGAYAYKALGATRFDTWRVHIADIENVTGAIYKLNLILISTNKQKIIYRTVGTDSNSGAKLTNGTFNILHADRTSDITDDATLGLEEYISYNPFEYVTFKENLKK